MKRKLWWGWWVVLVVLALTAGAAWAAPGRETDVPLQGNLRTYGQVATVATDRFTLITHDGREITLLVDEHTRFRHLGGEEAAFADVTTGQWVAATGQATEQENVFQARAVILLPDDFDPERWGRVARGTVKEVNPGAGTFVVESSQDGGQSTVKVDEQTRFQGVASLAELQPGTFVRAVGPWQDDGTLLARVVVARPGGDRVKAQRYLGRVAAVDPEAGTLTLTTRTGETVTVAVSDQTRFRGQVNALSDLQPEMKALVVADPGAEGAVPVARLVIAGAADGLPGERYLGQVTAVDPAAGTLTLQTRAGEEVTLIVDEHTRFRGAVHSLADLTPGQRVGVLAREGDDGTLLARWVVARR